MAGTILGGLFGQLLGQIPDGIDFCMTALFVIIFMDQWEKAKESYTSIDWTWNRDYLSALFWKKQFYFAGIDYCIWHFTFMAEKREKRGAL